MATLFFHRNHCSTISIPASPLLLPCLFFCLCLSQCIYFVLLLFLSLLSVRAQENTPICTYSDSISVCQLLFFHLRIFLVWPGVRHSSGNGFACLIYECHSREICAPIFIQSMCLIPKYITSVRTFNNPPPLLNKIHLLF